MEIEIDHPISGSIVDNLHCSVNRLLAGVNNALLSELSDNHQ